MSPSSAGVATPTHAGDAPRGPLAPLEELALLLRPAGGGVYVVSTGLAEQRAMQQRLYRVDSGAGVQARFRANLERIAGARAIVLGAPSDVGAGYQRGANLGPQGIRAQLLDDDPQWPERLDDAGVVDVGDVFVVPQLLHDTMLSDAQGASSRLALYPNVPSSVRATLPVSPLSISERALELIFSLNPRVRPIVLGGDHSNAWPVSAVLARAMAARDEPWGIVQIDAHTDLLSERLGVKYCFATWSYHANELVGRGGRLTQVGIRATRFPREHWENTLGVRQFWAKDCLRGDEVALDVVEEIVAHVKSTGVRSIYFSNDIDGTDAHWADATGTPEPDGLLPDFVSALLRRLADEFAIVAADVMEVAPPLEHAPGGRARTMKLAARYARESVEAVCRGPREPR